MSGLGMLLFAGLMAAGVWHTLLGRRLQALREAAELPEGAPAPAARLPWFLTGAHRAYGDPEISKTVMRLRWTAAAEVGFAIALVIAL